MMTADDRPGSSLSTIGRCLRVGLSVSMAALLAGCGARYQIESRTSNTRDDDGQNRGGTTIVIISSAEASTPASLEEAFPIEQDHVLGVSAMTLDTDEAGDEVLRLKLHNDGPESLKAVELRILTDDDHLEPVVQVRTLTLDARLAPGGCQLVETGFENSPEEKASAIYVTARPYAAGTATTTR